MFAQKDKKSAPKSDKEPKKKRACHFCGKTGCYPKKCDKRESISEAEWYIHTGKVLSQTIVDDNPTGFSGLQLAGEYKDEIILNSGSTISLFKDKHMLVDVGLAKKSLLMETNAGRKQIMRQCDVLGFGRVWYDPSAVSKLFSLSEIV